MIIWVCFGLGAWGDGIYKQNPTKNFYIYQYFPDLTDTSLSNSEVISVQVSKVNHDRVWLGTNGGGLNTLDTNTGLITVFKNNPLDSLSLSNNRVWAIEESSDSTLWIGTQNGLNYAALSNGQPDIFNRLTTSNSELTSNYIHSIIEDRSRDIWLSTGNTGILQIRRKDYELKIDKLESVNDSLSHYTIWPLLESSLTQTLWMGTYGEGVNSINLDIEGTEVDQHITNDSLFQSLKYILNLHEDQRGHIWIGTLGQGLVRLDPSTEQVDHFSVYNNLPHNSVSCIQSDNAGNLWVGTYDGLAFLDAETETIFRFSEADGLPGSYFFENACDADSEGTLYFGTNKGLLAFDPDEIWIDDRPPEVVITGVDLYNESMKLDTAMTHKKMVQLKHDENYLTVHFSGLHFANPEENMYSYKLEGVDRKWVTVGSEQRIANYTSLFPGKYVFQVKASNSDGTWASEAATMMFIVERPFWLKWWFIALCILIISGIFWSIHKFRVYHLLKLERARQQISADLHDNIGGSLTSIALFLEGLARQYRSDTRQEHRINYHARTSRQLVDDLRDTVWVVNTDYDSLPELVNRMEQLADNAPTESAVYFHRAADIPDIPLDMETRRNLLFIYKEAFNNAIRHAEARKIDITVNYVQDYFSFDVTDNGVGFNHNVLHQGHGLKNFKTRSSFVNGKLDIDSTVGKGTTISLSIKLPSKSSVYS